MVRNGFLKGLIVFAKKPVLGRVKTRLQPEVTPEETLKIYRAFSEDTIEKGASFQDMRIWLGAFPDSDDPWFLEISKKYSLLLFNQEGKDLGKRMEGAFHLLTGEKIDLKVIIGTDTPHLPLSYIRIAFDYLKTVPVVVGPSRDGGYYLLGISGDPPPIFEQIHWSTGSVFKETVQKLEGLKIPYRLLPEWFDIDTYQNLMDLYSRLSLSNRLGGALPARTWSVLNSIESFKGNRSGE